MGLFGVGAKIEMIDRREEEASSCGALPETETTTNGDDEEKEKSVYTEILR